MVIIGNCTGSSTIFKAVRPCRTSRRASRSGSTAVSVVPASASGNIKVRCELAASKPDGTFRADCNAASAASTGPAHWRASTVGCIPWALRTNSGSPAGRLLAAYTTGIPRNTMSIVPHNSSMPPPGSSSGACARLGSPVVLLMALATGLTVASNYYAQLSYALGLVLLVPLGDMLERRSLIVAMTILSACGLLMTASAPSFAFIMLGTAIAGALSVVAQVLIPLASTLAAPAERGKIVGTTMGGLLLGILLARTAAGALADFGNWRTVYWVAAALMLATAGALWLVLPRSQSPTRLAYPRLLASVFRLYTDVPLFRARSLLGALLFASFGMLWTPLIFLLASPPYSYSNGQIGLFGLFGLAGAAGAYAAKRFGRMADQGLGNRSTRIGLLLLFVSWLPIALGQVSVPALLLGIVLLDLAIQGVRVSNLSAIYRLDPDAGSRLSAGTMAANFMGAAAGSLTSSWLFSHAGWSGVCTAGALLGAAALAYASVAPPMPASPTARPPQRSTAVGDLGTARAA
jgi:predicted MFS family arabinose efflux permease